MTKNAPFSAAESGISAAKIHRPHPIPPRGELIAWIFTVVLTALSGLLFLRTRSLPFWASLFAILMLLFALAMRFSRWMEANTRIVLDPDGVMYQSPIRKQAFRWDQITEVSAYPLRDGWRMFVIGEHGGFRFETEMTLRGMDESVVRTGYPEGAEIVEQILRQADLREPRFDGTSWEWKRG